MTHCRKEWAEPEPALLVAAVLHGPGEPVDELLAAFAARQRQRGVRVRGLVQDTRQLGGGRKSMELIDLATGHRFAISQDLGRESSSCCLDPTGIAAAAPVLRRAAEQGAELVVVNRFGALEAEHGGFADELLALMADDIPLVTAVAERQLESWLVFSERRGALLAPSLDALESWAARAVPDAFLRTARGRREEHGSRSSR